MDRGGGEGATCRCLLGGGTMNAEDSSFSSAFIISHVTLRAAQSVKSAFAAKVRLIYLHGKRKNKRHQRERDTTSTRLHAVMPHISSSRYQPNLLLLGPPAVPTRSPAPPPLYITKPPPHPSSSCHQVTLVVLLFSHPHLPRFHPFNPLSSCLSVSRALFWKPCSCGLPSHLPARPPGWPSPSLPPDVLFSTLYLTTWGGNLYLLPPFLPPSFPAITPSISVGPLTLSPLPPCMCIILLVAPHSVTAYLLNLSPIHLFHPLPSVSFFFSSADTYFFFLP